MPTFKLHDKEPTVDIRHWGGQREAVPVSVARALVQSGHAFLESALPVETAMVEPLAERSTAVESPRARKGKPRKPKGGKGW